LCVDLSLYRRRCWTPSQNTTYRIRLEMQKRYERFMCGRGLRRPPSKFFYQMAAPGTEIMDGSLLFWAVISFYMLCSQPIVLHMKLQSFSFRLILYAHNHLPVKFFCYISANCGYRSHLSALQLSSPVF
jgi:hypothetical protein